MVEIDNCQGQAHTTYMANIKFTVGAVRSGICMEPVLKQPLTRCCHSQIENETHQDPMALLLAPLTPRNPVIPRADTVLTVPLKIFEEVEVEVEEVVVTAWADVLAVVVVAFVFTAAAMTAIWVSGVALALV